MPQVIFRLLKPNDIISNIVVWRIREPWSHAVIIFADVVYSSTLPMVQKMSIDHPDVACPPREGEDYFLELSQDHYNKMLDWCEKQVGKPYDYFCIFGWFFGIKPLQLSMGTYCFEFCWDALHSINFDIESEKTIAKKKIIERILLFRSTIKTNGKSRNRITGNNLIGHLKK